MSKKLSPKTLFLLGVGLLLFKQLIIKPNIGLGAVAGAFEILALVILGIALANFMVEKRNNNATSK